MDILRKRPRPGASDAFLSNDHPGKVPRAGLGDTPASHGGVEDPAVITDEDLMSLPLDFPANDAGTARSDGLPGADTGRIPHGFTGNGSTAPMVPGPHSNPPLRQPPPDIGRPAVLTRTSSTHGQQGGVNGGTTGACAGQTPYHSLAGHNQVRALGNQQQEHAPVQTGEGPRRPGITGAQTAQTASKGTWKGSSPLGVPARAGGGIPENAGRQPEQASVDFWTELFLQDALAPAHQTPLPVVQQQQQDTRQMGTWSAFQRPAQGTVAEMADHSDAFAPRQTGARAFSSVSDGVTAQRGAGRDGIKQVLPELGFGIRDPGYYSVYDNLGDMNSWRGAHNGPGTAFPQESMQGFHAPPSFRTDSLGHMHAAHSFMGGGHAARAPGGTPLSGGLPANGASAGTRDGIGVPPGRYGAVPQWDDSWMSRGRGSDNGYNAGMQLQGANVDPLGTGPFSHAPYACLPGQQYPDMPARGWAAGSGAGTEGLNHYGGAYEDLQCAGWGHRGGDPDAMGAMHITEGHETDAWGPADNAFLAEESHLLEGLTDGREANRGRCGPLAMGTRIG